VISRLIHHGEGMFVCVSKVRFMTFHFHDKRANFKETIYTFMCIGKGEIIGGIINTCTKEGHKEGV